MTITIEGGIDIGGGITIGEESALSFTLSPSDITQGYYAYNSNSGNNYPSAALGANGNEGFVLTFYPGQPSTYDWIGNDPYWCTISSSTIVTFFNDLVTNGYLTSPFEMVLFNVVWGAGSTYPTGVVALSGIGSVGNQMYMCPVDTTVTGWNTNPPNSYATKGLPGTYNFPATFTLKQPKVDKGGWC